MNRPLTVLIALMLTISGFAFLASSAEAAPSYKIAASFESGNDGFSVDSTCGRNTASACTGTYGMAMLSSIGAWIYHGFSSPTGNFTLTFNVKMFNDNIKSSVYFYSGTSSSYTSASKYPKLILAAGKIYTMGGLSNTTISTATWHRMIYAVNSDHTSYSITLDGTNLGSWSIGSGNELTGFTICSSSSEYSSIYVDNIYVDYKTCFWAPTLSGTPSTTAMVGDAYSFVPSANETVTWTGATIPAWASMASNGTVTGTPTESGIENFSIRATSSDGGLSAWKNWTVTISPARTYWAPTLSGTPPSSVRAGQEYSFRPSSNESVTWQLTTTAEWLAMQNATGWIHGRPYYAGSYSFSLKATSINGTLSAYINATITVYPTWPTQITSQPSTNFTLGHSWSYAITTNESCTIEILKMPSGCSFAESTNTFTWNPQDLFWTPEQHLHHHPEMQVYVLDEGELYYPAWPVYTSWVNELGQTITSVSEYIPMYQNFGFFSIRITSENGLQTSYQNFSVTVSRTTWTVSFALDEYHQFNNLDHDGTSDGIIAVNTAISTKYLYNETCDVIIRIWDFQKSAYITDQYHHGAENTDTGTAGWISFSYATKTISGYAGKDQIGTYRYEYYCRSVNGSFVGMVNPTYGDSWTGHAYNFTIAAPVPIISGTPSESGQVRVYYSWTAESNMAVVWAMNETDGLVIDHITGEVYGIPDAAGMFSVTIFGTSTIYGTVGSLTYNLTVLPAQEDARDGDNGNGGGAQTGTGTTVTIFGYTLTTTELFTLLVVFLAFLVIVVAVASRRR